VFHLELRQRPHLARAFNLSEEELRARFLTPLAEGRAVELGGRTWHPQRVQVRVLEGRRLEPGELMLGRGWANAQRVGEDVTARFAGQEANRPAPAAALERARERLLGRVQAGPLTLREAVLVTDELLAGHRASRRLALVEQAVWELLHAGRVQLLDPDGVTVESERWEQRLISWEAWGADQATASAISLARSSSEPNR
jgi:hypothetical protein